MTNTAESVSFSIPSAAAGNRGEWTEELCSTKHLVDATLDDFDPHPDNPRHSDNEKYEEIKHSIKTLGLQNKFVLTKKPSNNKFVTETGGGTRYKICTELWRETGDVKFYRFTLEYTPFISELRTLINHACENDSRSDLLWIENALQADKIIRELERDNDPSKLSYREKANLITAEGWRISHSHLLYYDYTVSRLLPFMPDALWAGMGRPKIKAIRKAETAFKKYCLQKDPGSEDKFQAAFSEVLKRHNNAGIDQELLELHTGEQVAKILAMETAAVTFDVMSDRLIATSSDSGSQKNDTNKSPGTTDVTIKSTLKDNTAVLLNGADSSDPQNSVKSTTSEGKGIHKPNPIDVPKKELLNQLVSLRTKACSIAHDLASEFDCLSSLRAVEDNDAFLGYLITDPPPMDFQNHWQQGVVYWRLYHSFYAAYQSEKAAHLLDSIDLDDIECDFGISAISQSPIFENGGALYLQWRCNDLSLRHAAGNCDEKDTQLHQHLLQLEKLLMKHGALSAALSASTQ